MPSYNMHTLGESQLDEDMDMLVMRKELEGMVQQTTIRERQNEAGECKKYAGE